MEDRELLELAAKTAVIEGEWCEFALQPSGDAVFGIGNPMIFVAGITRLWNPLTDDGDALRLAVECKLMIDTADWGLATAYWREGHLQDSCYRRAIVRAAAEIGKTM